MFRRPRPFIANPLPPADVVPRGTVLVEPEHIAAADRDARWRELTRYLHHALTAESLKDPGRRNQALIDAMLDARLILEPSEPDPAVLLEGPPVPVGHSVPLLRRAS
jgi:hypothetical protein